MKNSRNKNPPAISKEVLHPSLHLSIIVNGHHPSALYKVLVYCVIFTKTIIYFIYYKYCTYSAGMKERCRMDVVLPC